MFSGCSSVLVRATDSGTEGWIQGQRGGFRDRGVDSETEGWIQRQRGGFRDRGVDSHVDGGRRLRRPLKQKRENVGQVIVAGDLVSHLAAVVRPSGLC
jgi:hypothetical protein